MIRCAPSRASHDSTPIRVANSSSRSSAERRLTRAPSCALVDESFLRKLPNSHSHRSDADSKQVGEVAVPKPFARRKLSFDDELLSSRTKDLLHRALWAERLTWTRLRQIGGGGRGGGGPRQPVEI